MTCARVRAVISLYQSIDSFNITCIGLCRSMRDPKAHSCLRKPTSSADNAPRSPDLDLTLSILASTGRCRAKNWPRICIDKRHAIVENTRAFASCQPCCLPGSEFSKQPPARTPASEVPLVRRAGLHLGRLRSREKVGEGNNAASQGSRPEKHTNVFDLYSDEMNTLRTLSYLKYQWNM